MGDNKVRQKKAFAHQTFFLDPAGVGRGEMGVVDLGCDRVWFFDPYTMERRKDLCIKAAKGDGPRHALFLPRSGNKVLYIVNELGSSVSQYAFDGATFTLLAKTSMLPEGFSRWAEDGENLVTKAAAIKTTADGKIVMASSRGYDSIAFYEVGSLGKLKLRNIAKLRGKFPRDFELMPGERFMVVGHKMSNEIQVYAFDRGKCTLEPVGEAIPCWRPLCFKFL
jgi:6-phosphogluconolactonase